MSDQGPSPKRWAIDLNMLLRTVLGDGRFPVPLEQFAIDYSKQRFPGDPIVAVEGRALGPFEGALYSVHAGKAWAIIYNSNVTEGRRRFTIAHEFGHYLMHRTLRTEGFQCSEQEVTFRDGVDLEKEADTFAAYFLMPFDDFRNQLPVDVIPNLDDFSRMAKRYGVSLISCVLRWLEYTNRRSLIVISVDDFILWSKSSKSAFKSGLYFRTRGVAPVAVPEFSLISRTDMADIAREGIQHPAGVWFAEDCTEITVHSGRHQQAITILHFGRDVGRSALGKEPDEPDAYDRFVPKIRNRFGDE